MKTKLQKLLDERNRLATDLRKSPTGVNLEGKPFPRHATPYLKELDHKISAARTNRFQGKTPNKSNWQGA